LNSRLKIFLLTKNLYSETGGGQTVYRSIIKKTPKIDFYYLTDNKRKEISLPHNAHPIKYNPGPLYEIIEPALLPQYEVDAFNRVVSDINAISGMKFDFIEFPDYEIYGKYLKTALKLKEVEFKSTIIALHGNISKSIELNWEPFGTDEIKKLEFDQFVFADFAYCISKRYAKEWQERFNKEIEYIDPSNFIPNRRAKFNPKKIKEDVTLLCVSRQERRKGNDLFQELIRWLDKNIYKSVLHVGKSEVGSVSSINLLQSHALRRNLTDLIKFRGNLSQEELYDFYTNNRCIVILPVRYDTFNLVALEALFLGCPIAISDNAGICDYLDETFPDLPYIRINNNKLEVTTKEITEVIENYDYYRLELLEKLKKHTANKTKHYSPFEMYKGFLKKSFDNYGDYHNSEDFLLEVRVRRNSNLRKVIHKTRIPIMVKKLKIFLKKAYLSTIGNAKKLRVHYELFNGVIQNHRDFAHLKNRRENTPVEIKEKLLLAYKLQQNSNMFRCNYWMEIARLERIRGNDLIAATKELRLLRLIPDRKLKLLNDVLLTLSKYGFNEEAKVAEMLYSEDKDNKVKIYDYLCERKKRLRLGRPKKFEKLYDKRAHKTIKVSVIVSLYNAEEKLSKFINMLKLQNLFKSKDCEFIFVDSGSPSNEETIIYSELKGCEDLYVYARSELRETIQSAWNRGIHLSKGEYLVFLGVDEALYPDALETLSAELDRLPQVDWVMANSIVTEVDKHGSFEKDVMVYNRNKGRKCQAYLETCYISWVGGMYRKSIHERHGYYDETFGAAGDTEFKNRVLPFIKVAFIDKTLGIFWNYPDGQTTASPRAEIEDLRAWYIFRSKDGVKYAIEKEILYEKEKLLLDTLGYRKSFCQHLSTDIEYAYHLINHMLELNPKCKKYKDMLKIIQEIREFSFKYEYMPTMPGPIKICGLIINYYFVNIKLTFLFKKLSIPKIGLSYFLRRDNRMEQHSWIWKSE